MKQKILGFIASILFKLLKLSYRYEISFANPQNEKLFHSIVQDPKPDFKTNAILAFFHQDELCMLPYFINKKISILVSLSKDGQIMTEATKRMGFIPVRGSSSRGAVSGLIASIKKVREGYTNAIAVDGPKGPIYKVKEGAVAISNKTQRPIIPLRSYPSKAKTFHKAWNQAQLAYPFSTIRICVGDIKFYSNEELEQTLQSL